MTGVASGTPTAGGSDERAAFAMLGLAQLVLIFALWMAIWPAAFGIPNRSALATGLGVLFATGGAVGFYLGFRALGVD